MHTAPLTEHHLLALIEAELALPARSLQLATPVTQIGDSLDWAELLMAVEDAFGVELDATKTSSLATVADLLRLLQPAAVEQLQAQVHEGVEHALRSMPSPPPF